MCVHELGQLKVVLGPSPILGPTSYPIHNVLIFF